MRREPLRILLIEPQGRGGIWHYAHALAGALAATGVEIVLATVFPYEDLGDIGNVRVCSIGSHRAYSTGVRGRVQRVLQHIGKLAKLFGLMRNYRPQIVHLQGPLGKFDFVCFMLMKLLGARLVYTAHDARPLSRVGGWVDRMRLRHVDAVFVHSSNAVTELIADGVEPGKIMRLAHANYLHLCTQVDLLRSEARRLLAVPLDAKVVLFFGTVAAYKGLDLLIEAFSILHHEHAGRYLVIAGEPLEDFTPYRRQIVRLGIQNRVLLDLRYIPFDEFARYFLSADVAVLPYRRIYQSGILQLAYGFGTPLVVSNVGGLAEVVAEDHTGLAVPALEAQSLATAIRDVLGNPTAAAEMGRRGRALAEEKYSWGAVARKTHDVYRSIHPAYCAETIVPKPAPVHGAATSRQQDRKSERIG